MPPRRNAPAVPVWGHFTTIDKVNKKARCLHCHNVLSYKTTITNLKTHLKQKHPFDYEDMLNAKNGEHSKFNATDDDSNNSPSKFESEVWNYFEEDGVDRARCVVCRSTISASYRPMIKHLRLNHPKLVAELPQISEDDSDNDNTRDDQDEIYTEVVYLDESTLKKDVTEKITPKISNKSLKRRSEKKQTYNLSDDESVTKKKKHETDSSEEEIDNFTLYIKCLLKGVPDEVFRKLQKDIVNLVLNAKLKLTLQEQTPPTDTVVENRMLIDGVPVTLQAVGTVPRTSYMLAVPNTLIAGTPPPASENVQNSPPRDASQLNVSNEE